MNLIILFKDDFTTEPKMVRLDGQRFKHITEVNRAHIGSTLRVGLLEGDMGNGIIKDINSHMLEMEVNLDTRPPSPVPVTLLLAVPRPRVLKRTLAQVTAMGVKKIILINSYRVEKSFWKSDLLDNKNLKKYLIKGLEQGRDTILPKVITQPLFKPFVEDHLPDIIKGTTPFVAHPTATETCPCSIGSPVTLAIGPEGGFIPYEIEKLVNCGFTPIRMGERILPVETAVSSLISRLI